MKRFVLVSCAVLALAAAGVYVWFFYDWGARLSWRDVATFFAKPAPIGIAGGDPLERLGVRKEELTISDSASQVRYLGTTRYLNGARAVVTHTIDDSTMFLVRCLDTMDKYGMKATVFVTTRVGIMPKLWPRLGKAVANGHEIGSHARSHRCRPEAFLFCLSKNSSYELAGSRDDILAHTTQPHVWSYSYPCGRCSGCEYVHRKLAAAEYLVARFYPDREPLGGYLVPDLQTFAAKPYDAGYTQVVQGDGKAHAGRKHPGRKDVAAINAKFDEVYGKEGIYHFVSHPQWLEYGSGRFYEQHLAHVGGRADIWYVPLGPLYTYRTVVEKTEVKPLEPRGSKGRFAVYNHLDPKVFTNCITLQFSVPETPRLKVIANGRPLEERQGGISDRWDHEYFRRAGQSVLVTIRPGTIVEFR